MFCLGCCWFVWSVFIDCFRFFRSPWISNSVLQKNIQLERDNSRVGKQLNDLKVQQKQLKDQLQSLMDKFQKEIEDGQTIHNIQEQQKKIINEWVHEHVYERNEQLCGFWYTWILTHV